MARMTKRFPDGKAVVVCDSCEQKKDKQCTFSECRASLIKRLAAYEDIAELCGGVDRLREFAEADKDGRLVMLPCKVGDVMYKLFREYTECTSYQVRKDNYCCEGCMVPCDSREVTVIRAIQPNSLPEVVRYIEDIGKTVFLSRAEAERAIQEMVGKG